MPRRALLAVACFAAALVVVDRALMRPATAAAGQFKKGTPTFEKRIPTATTAKDRLEEAVEGHTGKSVVRVNADDVVAVGEMVPAEKYTANVAGLIRASRRSPGQKCFVEAESLLALLEASKPAEKADAHAEQVKAVSEESRGVPTDVTAKPPEHNGRPEVDHSDLPDMGRSDKSDSETQAIATYWWAWLLSLAILFLTITLIGYRVERRRK